MNMAIKSNKDCLEVLEGALDHRLVDIFPVKPGGSSKKDVWLKRYIYRPDETTLCERRIP